MVRGPRIRDGLCMLWCWVEGVLIIIFYGLQTFIVISRTHTGFNIFSIRVLLLFNYLECSPVLSGRFAQLGSPHVVGTCRCALMSWGLIAAGGAVVALSDIVPMGPAISLWIFVAFVVAGTVSAASSGCTAVLLCGQDGFVFLSHIC